MNHQQHSRAAFTLIEVMIALVILGLVMVMAATIFPVAWQRTLKLSEYTVQQTVLPAARTSVASLVPVSGPSFSAAGFAGDLIYDSDYSANQGFIVSISDTRVHALHLENIQVAQQRFVPENPWDIEQLKKLETIVKIDPSLTPGPDPLDPIDAEVLAARSYDTPQILFHQRIHPPMPKRIFSVAGGSFSNMDTPANWDDTLATRRYCWGILHRLREFVGPNPFSTITLKEAATQAAAAIGTSRSFDIYYVLLRRTQPTNRYAKQEPISAPIPNAFPSTASITPSALPGSDDVMFPVAWRVEIQFPLLNSAAKFTGIPTEIRVPPEDFTGSGQARSSFVQMFPRGAQFVDEISGTIYRVAKRRVIGTSGDPDFRAILTFDREIFIEDLDINRFQGCGVCFEDGASQNEELVRTFRCTTR